MNREDKARLDSILNDAARIIRGTPDSELGALLGDGILDTFIRAIGPQTHSKGPTPYPHLLENKNRLCLLALVHLAITRNYSFKGTVGGRSCFVSPTPNQWSENGVMFVQGKRPFEGMMGLFENDEVRFGIFARDIQKGEPIGPDDVFFVNPEEASDLANRASVPATLSSLEEAITTLEGLLESRNSDEVAYQSFLKSNPWVFGLQYSAVDSHKQFDDSNIPDFSALRARDQCRDIIEIKQPFLQLFKKGGSLSASFNDAWNQIERYLDFVRSESDYLHRQKELRFESPLCYLVAGYNLDKPQRKAIQRKCRLNPTIIFLTYNDLLAMTRNTVAFIKEIRS